MASLLEPVSNTKVHDHSSRSSRNTSSTAVVGAHDSYGDLWGENSFQSTVDEGRPSVIHEATAEQRWTGDGVVVPTQSDDFLSPPIKAPLNDEAPLAATITAIPKESRKSESRRRSQRRGSNDKLPIRPDRRGSVNTMNIGKADLAELMKFDNSPVAKPQLTKLDDYLEETKHDEANIDLIENSNSNELSDPVVAPLNDEVDNNDVTSPVVEGIPEDRRRPGATRQQRRGSNDLMPIRPNRRSSVQKMVVRNGDLAELMKLVDQEDGAPTPVKDDH